jgi:hypothetical protein
MSVGTTSTSSTANVDWCRSIQSPLTPLTPRPTNGSAKSVGSAFPAGRPEYQPGSPLVRLQSPSQSQGHAASAAYLKQM